MAEIPGQIFDFETNATSLLGHIRKIDSFTDVGQGGILGIMILIVVGTSLFLMMRSRGNERAFPVSALIVSVIGLLMRLASLVGDNVFWICIALFIVSIVLLIREQGQYE